MQFIYIEILNGACYVWNPMIPIPRISMFEGCDLKIWLKTPQTCRVNSTSDNIGRPRLDSVGLPLT